MAERTCSECKRTVFCRGMCSWHYEKARSRGPLPPLAVKNTTCTIADCVQPAKARTWCNLHYGRWRRLGSPTAPNPVHKRDRGAPWPSDDEIVALYIELGTRKALADRVGCHLETLKRYVKARPGLDARIVAAKPPPQTAAEASRRHRERHPERIKARSAAHYAAHREKILEANRRWHRENPDKSRLRKRRYDEANPDRVRATRAAWIERNRESVRRRVQLQYPARKGGPEAREYAQVLLGDPCCYCGAPMKDIDHIVPLSHGGTGAWDNLTAACASCNRSKQSKSLLMFMLARLDDIRLVAAS